MKELLISKEREWVGRSSDTKIERKKIRANEMLNFLQQKMGEQEMDKEIPRSQSKGLCCFRISDQVFK